MALLLLDASLPGGSVAWAASGRPGLASCPPPPDGRSRGQALPPRPSHPRSRSLEPVWRSGGRFGGPPPRPAPARVVSCSGLRSLGAALRLKPSPRSPLPSAASPSAPRSARPRPPPSRTPPGPPFVGGSALDCRLLRLRSGGAPVGPFASPSVPLSTRGPLCPIPLYWGPLDPTASGGRVLPPTASEGWRSARRRRADRASGGARFGWARAPSEVSSTPTQAAVPRTASRT